MKSIAKSLVIAFSMYSKIPMPQFLWEEEDMRYVMCFFPWVGIVIGALSFGWGILCESLHVNTLCYAALGTVIPILVSGGIHLDGYLDTMDALNSYQSRERKLEILKDSHIGAFAAIALALYICIYMGCYAQVQEHTGMALIAVGFVFSRVLSGIGVVSFPCAKHEGLLYLFSSRAQERIVRGSLIGQGCICVGVMIGIGRWRGVMTAAAALAVFLYYRKKCDKEFGGITGDTAGWFVTLCECVIAGGAACSGLV